MPIMFLIVGTVLIAAAFNDKLGDLGKLIGEDFNPSSNTVAGFHIWIIAIFVVGALGYIRVMRPVANAMLVLIIVTLLLSNKGFFKQFSDAIAVKGKVNG